MGNGKEVATFKEWVSQTGIASKASGVTGTNNAIFDLSEIILGDGHFINENTISDGTTINDKMFQSMDNVSHDYQLGTQFASTRALVEIPLFKNLFFEDTVRNTFPSPNNSLKLHFDTTLTAHTWNPSPVGRRYPSQPPSDRSAYSAFYENIAKGENFSHSTITEIQYVPTEFEITTGGTGYTVDSVAVDDGTGTTRGSGMQFVITSIGGSGSISGISVTNVGSGYEDGETLHIDDFDGHDTARVKIVKVGYYKVVVSNPKMFPRADTTSSKFNVSGVELIRQAFLGSGEYMIYTNNPVADNYLKVPDNPSYYSPDFFK